MSKVVDEEDFDSISSEDEEDNEYDEEIDEYDDEIDDDEEEDIGDNINKSLNQNYIDNEYDDDNDDDIEYDDDDEVEDNEPIENYLQKIDDNMKSNIISNFHPQLKPHNYEEILVLTKIERDQNGDIIDDLHKTSPFMTKYERARILAERTVQINSGVQSFLDESQNERIDGYLIAMEELKQKKIPFIIKRPLPNGSFEYWNANDLELL
jgi:DNA-directed RNA polymerases I, II, and III subunit RPABC2